MCDGGRLLLVLALPRSTRAAFADPIAALLQPPLLHRPSLDSCCLLRNSAVIRGCVSGSVATASDCLFPPSAADPPAAASSLLSPVDLEAHQRVRQLQL